MSRVHDALRRAELGDVRPDEAPEPVRTPEFLPVNGPPAAAATPVRLNIHPGMLGEAPMVPFNPAPESHLLDLNNSHETPAEEFRTLRTRLNHLQTLQPLHTVVVTSPSPAEGKTFSAVNLALAQSHLAESSVLLGDFDLRRPIIHNLFQIERAPGL
jgi:receptor protein-tyrosine kinase